MGSIIKREGSREEKVLLEMRENKAELEMTQKNQVPVDMLIEIFLRLPAKSFGRFVCVSKIWARIIRSEDFFRRFSSFRSSPKTQPRFLFAFNERIIKFYHENKAELEMKKKKKKKSPVPVRMLIEILLRLPAKSIVRFTCVSKLWATITHGEDFIKQRRFLLASNDRIKGYQENWHFFSKPTLVSTPLREPGHPLLTSQFPDLWNVLVSRNSPLVEQVEKPPPEFLSSTVCHLKKLRYKEPSYAHGLISFLYGQEQVVSNPSTGKSITLPTVDSTEIIVRSFLGYDPIHAQYKVLCLSNVTRFCEHQVLTLGGAQNWRRVQCSTPHCPLGTNSVCIDGVLYYTASASFAIKEPPLLLGFDLRAETLEIVSIFPKGIGSSYLHTATLINYHGKVALVTGGHASEDDYTFIMWVLEDAKKQEWSKQELCFSLNGTERHHSGLKMLGVSDMGEFIYAPIEFKELYVYFVVHKSNRIRCVELLGNTNHKFREFYQVFTFLHHVESLMFI